MTIDFPNQVVIDEQPEEIPKEDNKLKVAADFLPHLPQEQCLLPHQRLAQSDKKTKQKQINKGNKDQEGRHTRYDPIPVSYAHLLPILVNAGALVPKQTKPAKFPYRRKHDLHAMCGYHVGYVGHSTEACHVLKTKVQELIDRNLLCFTPVTTQISSRVVQSGATMSRFYKSLSISRIGAKVTSRLILGQATPRA
ncbi:hypothetical protein KIW84_023798 [Lathyrus oleraceus]|uniref:Uncharacterized protein n=1 Tax=Pisum sativum TaxID=3888 RepID=A0A9D4YDW0_PEA|nr:hypothetical protein KIW84_023798 [Pisum sativum]